MFKEQKYLNLALDAGEVVWQRGLLRKGYSICHGVAGNAYCFLDLYQTTKVGTRAVIIRDTEAIISGREASVQGG